jgi:hypothetical protein
MSAADLRHTHGSRRQDFQNLTNQSSLSVFLPLIAQNDCRHVLLSIQNQGKYPVKAMSLDRGRFMMLRGACCDPCPDEKV